MKKVTKLEINQYFNVEKSQSVYKEYFCQQIVEHLRSMLNKMILMIKLYLNLIEIVDALAFVLIDLIWMLN